MSEQVAQTATPTQPAAAPPAPASAPAVPKGAAPAVAAPPAVQGAQAKLEAQTGEAAPEQKQGETNAQYELRLAKLTREAQTARAEAEKHKTAAKAAADAAELLKAELEKAKSKRMTKREFQELVRTMATDPTKVGELLEDDDLPPAVRKLKEELEAQARANRERDEARQQEEQRAAMSAQRQRELTIVDEHLGGEAFPLFDGLERQKASAHVLDLWHQRWKEMGGTQEAKPDLAEVAAEVHEAVARNLQRALQSDRSRNFLLGRVPELKALLAGGAEAKAGSPPSDAQGAGSANGRAAAPDPARDTTTSKPATDAEKKRARVAALQAARAEWQAKKEAKRAG